jgi:hypothetical protein
LAYTETALYVDSVAYAAVAQWAATHAYSVGNIVRQLAAPGAGNDRCFICLVGGTSQASEPTWNLSRGATNETTVHWMECTGLPAPNGDSTNTPSWLANQGSISVGRIIKNTAATSYFICTTAGTGGTGAEPTWNTTAGATTTDGSVTWTCLGATSSFATRWAAPCRSILGNSPPSSNVWVVNAGMTVFVGDDHNDPGTSSFTAPFSLQMLCVDHTATFPLTSANLKTTAAIPLTSSNIFWNNNSNGYVYGLQITGGAYFTVAPGLGNGRLTLEQCLISSTSGSSRIDIGDNQSAGGLVTLRNCTFHTSDPTQSLTLFGNIRMEGCSLTGSFGGSGNQILSGASSNNTNINFIAEGCDFSTNVSSGANLVGSGSAGQPQGYMLFKDCLIRSDYTAIFRGGDAAITGNLTIDLNRCDSGGTNYRNERHSRYGTLTTSTAVVRTGGSTDGATPISHQTSSTTNALFPHSLFDGTPLAIWNAVTGSNRNVTVYGIANDNRVPNNDEVWFNVEYLGSTSNPQGSYGRGGKGVLGTAAALTADTSAWDSAAAARANTTAYVVGNVIKTASNVGRVFFCTGAGTSAASAPAGGGTPTWSTTDINNMTLSSGNLTATSTSAINPAVRGNLAQVGKIYFEVVLTSVTGTNESIGISNSTVPLTGGGSIYSNGTGGATLQTNSGNVVVNATTVASGLMPAVTNGQTVCVATDLINNRIWFRINGGNWNNSSTANPTTNIGGIDISTVFAASAALPFVGFLNSGAAAAANFGSTSFAFTVPTGFSGFSTSNYSTAVDGQAIADGTATFRAGCRFSQTITLGALGPAMTWNPADINASTLSNGNLTVSGAYGVRSINGLSSGKVYFEMSWASPIGSTTDGCGILSPGASFVNYKGNGLGGLIVFSDGPIYYNGASTGINIGAVGNGNKHCFAVDLGNKRLWVRINGGNWNGNATYDPVANIGGIDISSLFPGNLMYASFGAGLNGSSVTANFGATSFAQTVPSGFSAWNSLILASPQPGQPGYLYAYPKIGRPSMTYYLDPMPVLS